MLRELSYMSRVMKIKGGRKGSAAAKESRQFNDSGKYDYER